MDLVASHIMLSGNANYVEWNFVNDLIVKRDRIKAKKSKTSNEELDVILQTHIALSVNERIFSSKTECTTYIDMLGRLENLYGVRRDDLI